MKKIIMAIPLIACLAACSTVPAPTPKIEGPAVIFVRDTGATGSACTYNALVDGEVIGQLKPGESIVRRVTDGKHRVGIENATAICPNIIMSKVLEISGAAAILRVGITSNFQTIFDQVE